LATNDHFSSNWDSRVRGGNRDQLVVEVVGVIASDPAQAADRTTIDLAEPAGLTDAASLGDMLQDRVSFLRWESGVEEGCSLSLREASLTSLTAEHASGLARAIATGHREISCSAFAVFGALGIQAAEAREVVHGAAPPVRSSRMISSCVTSVF